MPTATGTYIYHTEVRVKDVYLCVQFNYDYNGDESEVHAILDVEWTTVGLAIDNPSRTGGME